MMFTKDILYRKAPSFLVTSGQSTWTRSNTPTLLPSTLIVSITQRCQSTGPVVLRPRDVISMCRQVLAVYSWREPNSFSSYVFGWGRRYCVGSALAEASLFIICARIIWALDFYAPAAKGDASPVPDVRDEHSTWTSGLLSAPKCFSVGWKARDEGRRALVQRAFQEAQAEWSSRHLEQDVR